MMKAKKDIVLKQTVGREEKNKICTDFKSEARHDESLFAFCHSCGDLMMR
jgi:hypothetical protein